MAARTPVLGLVLGLALAIILSSVAAPRGAAGDVGMTLYGSRAGGWGFAANALSSPGPNLEVTVGDRVTLNLYAADGFAHDWYIDYNGNDRHEGTEPQSPELAQGSPTVWTSTADRDGVFAYRSSRNQDGAMWGNITILVAPPAPETWPYVLAGLVGTAAVLIAIATWWVRTKRGQEPPPP